MRATVFAMTALILGTCAAQTAMADNWVKKLDCGNGTLIVDEICYGYHGAPCYSRQHQLVIHDESLIQEIVSRGGAGTYNHNGGSPYFSYQSRPLIVRIDSAEPWGYAGSSLVSLSIPYADDSYRASYYINFLDDDEIRLKVWKHNNTRNDIVPQGQLVERVVGSCVRY